MTFVFKTWESFCRSLQARGIFSIPAAEILQGRKGQFLTLKHDVETDVPKAYEMAKIEKQYGHRGSYYVQAYLLREEKNLDLLRKMQDMGHEISYHYDVLDASHGDLPEAMSSFADNLRLFSASGFEIITLCQHGNPVAERKGYHSNRDFFRNEEVQRRYPGLADIMVDFPDKAGVQYCYFSDAGRQMKLIFDPLNNDIVKSDDKDIVLPDLKALDSYIEKENCIISVHPHRWTATRAAYVLRNGAFSVIRAVAKLLMKIPFCKKLMSRYFYLAKKL